MNKIVVFLTLLMALASSPAAPADFTGVWKGSSLEHKTPVEITLYLSKLAGGSYTGLVVQSAKGAWFVNRSSMNVFPKTLGAKKRIIAYEDDKGQLKIKEIQLIEKDTKYDWTLDKYHFNVSNENGAEILRSPLVRLGYYDMQLELKRESSTLPEGIDKDFLKEPPYTISGIGFTNKEGAASPFRYNDSGKFTFNLKTHGSAAAPLNALGILQAANKGPVFLNNQTNKLVIKTLKSGSGLPETNEIEIRSGYFDADSIRFSINIWETYNARDSFLLCSGQLVLPAEGFFKKKPKNFAGAAVSERLKYAGCFYGMQKGDKETAFRALDALATKGDIKARTWCSIFYSRGEVRLTPLNEKAAKVENQTLKVIEENSRNGDIEAMFLFFNTVQLLNKTEGEKRFGFTLLATSAENGFPPALFDLSRVLLLQKRYEEAMVFAQKAYARNVSKAAAVAGYLYENGMGVKTDVAAAQLWYHKGIAAGDDEAMMAMALLYNKGKDISPDVNKALAYAGQAALKKNTAAMVFLGNLYFKGNQGLKQNYPKAVEWFKKAAALHSKEGMFALGLLYSNSGEGGVKDEKSSFYWIRNAAVEGEPRAMKLLSKYYAEGTGTEPARLASRFWYTQSVKNGGQHTPAAAQAGNDLESFWNYADFSPTYYRDVSTGEIYSSGPDIMGGIFSGLIGSYFESRSSVQEQINGLELMYEKNGKRIYGGTVSSSFRSDIRFSGKQQLKIASEGAMKLGWMLSGISPYGTQGYQNYSIDAGIPHGAFIVRLNKNNWVYAGKDYKLDIPEDGFLEIAVNDNDYTNNVGYFDFTIISD